MFTCHEFIRKENTFNKYIGQITKRLYFEEGECLRKIESYFVSVWSGGQIIVSVGPRHDKNYFI